MRCMALAAALALTIAGCEAPPAANDDPFAVAPRDFSLDVTILVGHDAGEGENAAMRPSRYVLFPDGSLRFASGPGNGPDTLPPLTRRLNRRQVAGVWSLARQIGFADPAKGDEPTNFDLVRAGADEIVYLFSFTGDDDCWEFIRRAPAGGPPDEASVQLVDRLAKLAWATDVPETATIMPPRRYDFGPDPYARYRR